MAQVGLCLVDWDQQEARPDQVREGQEGGGLKVGLLGQCRQQAFP